MKAYQFLCGCKKYSKTLTRNIYMSSNYYQKIYRYPKIVGNEVLQDSKQEISLEDKIFNSLKHKLVYNSLVTRKNLKIRWKLRAAELMKDRQKEISEAVPVSLKYMFEDCDMAKCSDEKEVLDRNLVEDESEDEFEDVNMPYSLTREIEVEPDDDKERIMIKKQMMFCYQDVVPKPINGRQWMSDYEVFDEELDENSSFDSSEIDYGTADPRIPASNVPCGGCGAHFHCKDTSIPGFLPKELFTKSKIKDLKNSICQRCTFLKNYNTALAVNVDPKSYPELLAKIKNKDAVVVLMIDMTDFPCSIWPNLLSVIGEDKPLIVIGNKIDLLPGDSPGWLETAKKSLRSHLPPNANILHVGFTSARTGFGVEELINKLHRLWGSSGDVYIVGCTNVGKSSLFNILIASDYCRSRASDLIQRAVTSPWPGTTLNLLKFPIMKMDGYKAFLRTSRLVSRKIQQNNERRLAQIQATVERKKLSKLPNIVGTIEQTFKRPRIEFSTTDLDDNKLFEMQRMSVKQLSKNSKIVFDADSKEYKTAKWCFDTPGVVHEDQIIDLLTTDEIVKTIPQSTIIPKIFSVRADQTMFIGGLARIDVLNCDYKFSRIIVYSSSLLPITICETKFATEVYDTLLGTSYMAVPIGSLARLEKWPDLKYRQDFPIEGKGFGEVTSEIVLSSIGWIGISLPFKSSATIRPWTPLARGIHLRNTPVLPLTARLRKKRMANTPTYFMGSI